MMGEQKNKILADSSLITGAGILGTVNTLDLPSNLAGYGEPLGLILAVLGAVLKLVNYIKTK
jgi:hypothetical protein